MPPLSLWYPLHPLMWTELGLLAKECELEGAPVSSFQGLCPPYCVLFVLLVCHSHVCLPVTRAREVL